MPLTPPERLALALVLIVGGMLALPFERLYYPKPRRVPTQKEIDDYLWEHHTRY